MLRLRQLPKSHLFILIEMHLSPNFGAIASQTLLQFKKENFVLAYTYINLFSTIYNLYVFIT